MIGAGLLATGVVTITLPEGTTIDQMFEAYGTQTASAVPAAPAIETPGPAPSPAATAQPCRNGDVFILVGIVMLFGLSERALTSFEDRIFPQKS